jgi:hypothetical protein
MQDGFDPYQQWLGIPAVEQPPDHYRLLGLPPFTGDRTAISRAAEARIAQVRLADAGRQPQLAERLVAALTMARQTLLDPPKKLTYDAILRGARVSLAAGQPAPNGTRVEKPRVVTDGARVDKPRVAPGEEKPFVTSGGARVDRPPLASDGARVDKPTLAPGANKPFVTPGVALFLGIAGVGGAAIVVGLILCLGSMPRHAKHNPSGRLDDLPVETPARPGPATTARPAQTTNPSARPAGPERPSPRVPPASPPALAGKQPVAPPPNVADSRAQGQAAAPPSAEIAALLTAARRAMFERDLKVAGQDVDRALRTARSDGDRAAAERVARLLHSLETFWQAARDGCRQLQTAEELEIADTRVIVVGVDATGITIRAAGRNLDYGFQELPRPLAVLAAERKLGQDPQAMHLHVGSFLAVDRRGDRQEARRRWEKAGPDGQSLMPEAALAPPVETIKPSK